MSYVFETLFKYLIILYGKKKKNLHPYFMAQTKIEPTIQLARKESGENLCLQHFLNILKTESNENLAN